MVELGLTTPPRPLSQSRLEFLDGLRGVLCLAVVFHHFLCGYEPCTIFGESPEWISEPISCHGQSPVVFLQPFINGRFAVTVFYVLSGAVLSHSLFSADESKWRIAVVKRYFRLALPCAAAMIFSYLLGGSTVYQQVALETKSIWLEKDYIRCPSFGGFLLQLIVGVSHGKPTLNNAMWTMDKELLGSFLVFMLVAVTRGCTPQARKRIIAAVFFYLLIPNVTLSTNLKVQLGWQNEGEEMLISMNPAKHFHILQKINDANPFQFSMRMKPLKAPSSSSAPPEEQVSAESLPTPPEPLGNMRTRTSGVAIAELLEVKSFTKQEMVKSDGWISFNPYMWYAPFVAGVWIADQSLQSHQPQASKSGKRLPVVLLFVGYAVASFPFIFSTEMHQTNWFWSILDNVAAGVGLGVVKDVLWYIVGAACIVQAVVLSNVARRFLTLPPLKWLGKVSFALYLVHIPILFTLTGHIFLNFLSWGWTSYMAGRIALLCSLPIMLVVAEVFFQYVEGPAIRISQQIGRKILGVESK